MLKNYLTIALRTLVKYRRFAIINILGLSVGLAVLILTQVVVEHETSYDRFFPDHERIYAVYTDVNPQAGYSVQTMDGVFAAVRPLLGGYVPEIELSARARASEVVVRAGDDAPFYQQVRFVDPEFLDIFAFDHVDGIGARALAEPGGVVLSEAAARRYFGTAEAAGRTLTINDKLDVRVTAVIRDLPENSHFTSSLLPPGLFDPKFEMLASMDTWRSLGFGEPDRDWGNINPWDPTYVLLREGADRARAEEGLARLYDEHFDGDVRRNIAGLGLRPLVELSQYLWNATGIPVPQSVRILGFLVLGIAILNYAILANAQAMARTREIALRKILGAGRSQLAVQFLFESVLLSALALIPALALLEIALPWIGTALGQDIRLLGDDAFGQALLIAGVTLGTGLLAGLYPAVRIARMPSLVGTIGSGGNRLTRVVIGLQFLAASVLGGLVLVIHAQNLHMRAAAGASFDNDRIVVLERAFKLPDMERRETLKRELLALPEVEAATYVSQLPYMQGTRSEPYARSGESEASAVTLLQLWGDHDVLDMLDIPILAGRNFSVGIASDRLLAGEAASGQQEVNVILNETAVRQLGWASPDEGVGETIRFVDEDEPTRAHRVVGVMADVNYLGLHNRIWPTILVVRPESGSFLALRLREGASAKEAGEAIDAVWKSVAPDVPVVRKPLSVYFDELIALFSGIGAVLAPLAAIAAALAFFGLFGLAAYATERRRREIGIRKVLGAGSGGIVRLVLWQMSRPVMVALVLAMPMAWFGADFYLRFFSDRMAGMPLYLVATAIAALGVAAAAIATHAVRLSHTHPTLALREE